MQRKSFEKMSCPIARSLERVGEWWSMLIMRDALHGLARFDEFQNSLGIAPNILTRRFNSLVDAGLLERRHYSDHPPRHEYVPTMCGRDLLPVSLRCWRGATSTSRLTASVVLINRKTGAAVDPILSDPPPERRLTNRTTRSRQDPTQTLGFGRDMPPWRRRGHRATQHRHSRGTNDQAKRNCDRCRCRAWPWRSTMPAVRPGGLSRSGRRADRGQDQQSCRNDHFRGWQR